MNKEQFIERINTKAWSSPVPNHIIENCYKIFLNGESQWKYYADEPIYIIGLSEDRYDYYWVGINNKERKLKFINCLYSIDQPCNKVAKTWNKDECKNIIKEVKNYFKTHSDKENIIYLDNKLF